MKKRILAAALCLALLSGCGARPPLDLPHATALNVERRVGSIRKS